jgi:ABC-2 type transport system permease protein
MVGIFGEWGMLGEKISQLVKWSLYGVVKRIISSAMQPVTWNQQTPVALLATLVYAIIFSAPGIKKFRWNAR